MLFAPLEGWRHVEVTERRTAVLDVYTRPHDPARPLVCLDETSKQLVADMRRARPNPCEKASQRGTTTSTSASMLSMAPP